MRRRVLALIALAMLTFAPRAVFAQSAAAWRDSSARLFTLERALRDSMVRGDSTTQEVARNGNLVIAASPNDRTVARDALRQFAASSNRWFGGAMPAADGFHIAVRTEAGSGGFGRPREIGAVVLAGLPDTGTAARLDRTAPPSDVSSVLIDAYATMMWGSVPHLRLWLDFDPRLSTPEVENRQFAMYALVTATGHGQRECAEGNLTVCAYALLLRQPPTGVPALVMAATMRADLLFTALRLGGSQAWTRLRAADDSGIEPELAAAAGMPIDSLLAKWRGELLALRPTEMPLTTSNGIAVICWSVALLLGALGASRWA
ncbi:MAG: hypothetical protein ACREK8_00625 [Gemmatimonadales bacterium]